MAQDEKRKKNRIRRMILSVIIAIVAWGVVTYTTDPDITKSFAGIRVEIVGEKELAENGYLITDRDDIPNMTVKMTGKRSDLMKALDKVKVIVDVSEVSETGEVEVEGTVKLSNPRITVEKMSSQTVPVNVVKLETEEIPVKVMQSGLLSGKLVESIPEKKSLTVKGSKSDLEKIKEAQVTVDISTMTQTTEEVYSYSLIISEGVEKESLSTIITDDPGIKITNIVYNEKEVPVKAKVKGESDYSLDEEQTKVEPEKMTIGVPDGFAIDYVIVSLEEKAGDGEYAIDKIDSVYIPEKSRKVTVKPVWKE